MRIRHGLALVLFPVLTACRTLPPPETQPAPPAPGSLSVLDFGARADGVNDDTAAIQAAIDAASDSGSPVLLPPGRYLVTGALTVKPNVALRGANSAPMSINALAGTVICATGGRDNENAPPLFVLEHAASVSGLTVFYPEQSPADIHPYPWTFHLNGFDNTVENVTLINSYNGLKTGPGPNVRHRIRSLCGCVLRRGILIDACTDIGRVENVQFHCHWWSDAVTGGNWDPVFNYMVENLEAFVFGRTDWEYVTNTFVFPAKIGYRFIKTDAGECNGQFFGIGADATETSLQVDAIQQMGLLITNGQFVSFTGVNPVQIRVNETNIGSVRFVNCAFWGPSKQSAIIKGRGNVSFSDCMFRNQLDVPSEAAVVQVDSGHVQINNCSFFLPPPDFPQNIQPGVFLGEGVAHAIVTGNNGSHGLHIIDKTAGRSIIRDNEPAHAERW